MVAHSEPLPRAGLVTVPQEGTVEQVTCLLLGGCRPLCDFLFRPPQELVLLATGISMDYFEPF